MIIEGGRVACLALLKIVLLFMSVIELYVGSPSTDKKQTLTKKGNNIQFMAMHTQMYVMTCSNTHEHGRKKFSGFFYSFFIYNFSSSELCINFYEFPKLGVFSEIINYF